MKKLLLFIALCLATVAMTAQTVRTLTFEDTAGSNYWGSKIDSPQYGGPLLYPSGSYIYTWCDSLNTKLRSAIPANYGEHKYWGGGVAISNYWNGIESEGDYLHQLSVYVPNNQNSGINGHGYNNSNNFAVHFGYKDGSPYNFTENLPYIEFSDGIARKILGMYVNNTTYFVNVSKNGNDFSPAIGVRDYARVKAKGYKADGSVDSTYVFIGRYNNIVEDWTYWDLSSLDEVTKVEFNIESNVQTLYGMSLPAYFCYDNITVDFSAEADPINTVESELNKRNVALKADSEVKNLKVTLTDKSESLVSFSGEIPEGLKGTLQTQNPKMPDKVSQGEANILTLSGMPANAKVVGITAYTYLTDPIFGKATIIASIGNTQIGQLDYCGFLEEHGTIVDQSYPVPVVINLNEQHFVGQQDIVIICKALEMATMIDSYEISYTIDDPTGINEVKNNVEDANPQIFTIDGRQVRSTTTPGLYIINGKKTFVK
ncbi:MAG: DUF4465 domain-containing protein [Muribaculaceae bacterium]|nr:DUF4465 domain-containing protein [Muribaculaceae bacterium]